jgi:hypothetical protein
MHCSSRGLRVTSRLRFERCSACCSFQAHERVALYGREIGPENLHPSLGSILSNSKELAMVITTLHSPQRPIDGRTFLVVLRLPCADEPN